jgi:prepilin-type N-terminal cleavage/methylation domain-containing protein
MMTSETGDPRGFTLIEILLVLALIALFGWIFIGGSSAMMTDRALAPDDQFWKACASARKEALEEQQSVLLSFDARAHAFVLNDGSQKTTQTLTGPDDLVVDFHPAQSDNASLVLIGGTLVETQPLASVTFYSDGTCTPFRAQFRSNGGAHMLAIDPWTCAPVLTKTNATP